MIEESEEIIMRGAKDEKERMYAALTSKNEDLFEYNGRIIVYGKNKEGENIYLGDVSEAAIYQKNVNGMGLIEKVRFGK